MNTNKYAKLENKKIADIAREYKKNGYDVITEPSRFPVFLRNIRPDLVAVSERESVVVEIVSKDSIRDKDRLSIIAKAVESVSGWRFEVVVTNPKSEDRADISDVEILSRLDQSKELIDMDMLVPCLLNLWGAIDALLRKYVNGEQSPTRHETPLKQIKNLYSTGIISRSEYEILEDAAKLRNLLIHGYVVPSDYDLKKTAMDLVSVGLSFLNQLNIRKSNIKKSYTVDELVEWFHQNYKDPANGVPYESAEGGYIYFNGGPYDAWDELWSNFPDADEQIIEEAVDAITVNGYEWVKKDQY